MATGFFQRRGSRRDNSLVTELLYIVITIIYYFLGMTLHDIFMKKRRLTGGVVQDVGGYFCYTVLFPLRAGVFFGQCDETLFLRIEPDRHKTVRGIRSYVFS